MQSDTYILRAVNRNMGYLILIVACVIYINADIATNTYASDICYNYTKLVNTLVFGGVAYTELKTVSDCQQQCNINETCLGINFDIHKSCFLVFSDVEHSGPIDAKDIDSYFRYSCADTTKGPHCIDTFTITNNTNGIRGQYVVNIYIVELCTQKCLSFSDTSKFCYGFDFNENNHKCFLYWDEDVFTENRQYITHYTRQSCIKEGNYSYIYTLIITNYSHIVIYTLPSLICNSKNVIITL